MPNNDIKYMMAPAALRHDEQADETHYDGRLRHQDSEDEEGPGKVIFPKNKLFGRDREMGTLIDLFCTVAGDTSSDFSTFAFRALFIEGFSGSGKSSLVHGFTQELTTNLKEHFYASGKYNEHVSVEPFSAINEAINALIFELRSKHPEALKSARREIRKSGGTSEADAAMLVSILPALAPLFASQSGLTTQDKNLDDTVGNPSPQMDVKTTLGLLFADTLQALCRGLGRPLILFLDDLQWADISSIELLEPLLSDPSVQNLFFIGGFRSNEVGPDHRLRKYIETCKGVLREKLCQMEVSNLSLESVTCFIAETLELKTSEVQDLSRVVFSRTLGNIFFCRQAIEELVRKSVIYYDMVFFQWSFNLSGLDVDVILSPDIVSMIQSKVDALPNLIKQVLVVAAYIRSSIDSTILLKCLRAWGMEMDESELQTTLTMAEEEGLLLRIQGGGLKFAHDKVLEASYTSISAEEQYQLKAKIAGVLYRISSDRVNEKASSPENEWILFVAAEYYRSIPIVMAAEDALDIAAFFLRVAGVSSRRGSYQNASRYLYAGVECLRARQNMWEDHREICFTMLNNLILIEFARGDMDGTKRAIDEVIWNGKSNKETIIANHTKVEWIIKTNSRNYTMGSDECIRVLASMGLQIPKSPSRFEMLAEYLRTKCALRGRSISAVIDLPIAKDDNVMKMLLQLCETATLAHNHTLNEFCTLRAIRTSLSIGITKYLTQILTAYTVTLRRRGDLHTAFSFAHIVSKIYNRFPDDRGAEYARAQMVLDCGVLPLKNLFSSRIDPLFACYKLGIAFGIVETALTSVMMMTYHYYVASLPLNTVFDAKLTLFQEKATLYHMPSFHVFFKGVRQFQLNLVHTSEKPTELNGLIMKEEEVLATLDGNAKNMTVRDYSLFRLILAVVFDDEEAMHAMVKRLEPFPFFDLPVARMHMRHLFDGMACLILGRRQKNRDLIRKGRKFMNRFRKLERIGSENAPPVYKCLRALLYQSQWYFDEAIASCEASNLLHLAALMNEHCGYMLRWEKKDQKLAEQYICNAFLLYNDWGAFAKVSTMKNKYSFLQTVPAARKSRTSCTLLTMLANQKTASSAADSSIVY